MKNIFKLMGIALIAGGLMVACGPKEEAVMYTITVNANDATMGTVTGGGEYEAGETVTLTATPNEGYQFVDWSDGITANPRTITVSENFTYTANFRVEDGVKVSFGTTAWDAVDVLGSEISSYALLQLGAFQDYESSVLPYVQGYVPNSVRSATHAQGDYYYFFYYENDNDFTIDTDGSLSGTPNAELPNWQPRAGFTENVTAIDLTAMTITATANGTLFYLPDAVNQTTTEKNLSIAFNNAAWEATSKANLKPMGNLVK